MQADSVFNKILAFSTSPYFPLLVGLLCFIDTFIPIVPNDILLAAAVAPKPDQWLFCALVQTAAITCGCISFYLVALTNPEGVKEFFPSVFNSDTWLTVNDHFKVYGVFAALVGSAILPIHPFLFVGALSGTNIALLTSAITFGRLVRNTIVCYLTAATEKLYSRKNN